MYECSHDVWVVRRLTSKARACNQLQKLDYGRKVYDVELEKNHTLLVERDGKVSWGSNCRTILVHEDSDLAEARIYGFREVVGDKKVSDKTEFEALGTKISEEDLTKWNESLGISPLEYLSQALGIDAIELLEQGLVSTVMKFTNRGTLRTRSKYKNDKYLRDLNLVYDPITARMYVDTLEMKGYSPLEAARFLLKLYQGGVSLGEKMGMEEVWVVTDGLVGAFTHIRLGFLPMIDDWNTLRRRWLKDIEKFNLKPHERQTVTTLLSISSEKAITALVNLDVFVDGLQIGRKLLQNVSLELRLLIGADRGIWKETDL